MRSGYFVFCALMGTMMLTAGDAAAQARAFASDPCPGQHIIGGAISVGRSVDPTQSMQICQFGTDQLRGLNDLSNICIYKLHGRPVVEGCMQEPVTSSSVAVDARVTCCGPSTSSGQYSGPTDFSIVRTGEERGLPPTSGPNSTSTQTAPPPAPAPIYIPAGCYNVGGGLFFSNGQHYSYQIFSPATLFRYCGTLQPATLRILPSHLSNVVAGVAPLPLGCYQYAGQPLAVSGTGFSCVFGSASTMYDWCRTRTIATLLPMSANDLGRFMGVCG